MEKANKESQSPLSFLKNLLIARWRSLLLLLIGVYLPLQVFEILTVKIWENQAGFPWDVPILLAVHSTANPQFDVLAVTLAIIGLPWMAIPILGAIALILLLQKRWRSLAYLLTVSLGSVIINRTAKELMHRVRPQLWQSIAPESSFAFPSGHAMTSITLVAILLSLTWASSWRWLVFSFGSLYIIAIAWCRLYLGVHFPSDILAGWMVTLGWTIGVSIIIKPYITKVKSVDSELPKNETTLLPEEEKLINEE
ncbi:phosphatase PAP2 family protein [Nostoc sp. UCD121]|uniref:phosphatase PAP2 family protein n=1 Tax=unclassified Nostoc TaxID=2593658 RepID=UPI001625E3DE|nr:MULTISPECIES: phosphatase PAP2 family protein [unclassified Nostoc]MBC1220500.1 phosphatase PAP2 family protein [Nostoc sp. UCD120]MBC1279860.1 phosphatase PAP2 family protein [Nostoc sp. UCD121]MBC1299843.1 phosphatase PAP2 family protein [Nostoc sp. UCD122]